MTEQKSPAELAAESSSEDTRSFVRRVKRATRRKYCGASATFGILHKQLLTGT